MLHKTYKRFAPFIKNVSWETIAIITSLVLLLCASIYFGLVAHQHYLNVQDAILYPYLLQEYHRHDLVLPSGHANYLKFPLFFLQAALPYNQFTLALVDVGLVVVTCFGWIYLLYRLFGKKYIALASTLLASFLTVSPSLALNLAETTIRNIEYPLGLAFVVMLVLLVTHHQSLKRYSKKQLVGMGLLTALFALSVASDTAILYIFCFPVLVVFGLVWLRTGSKKVILPSAVLVGSIAAAALFQVVGRRLSLFYSNPNAPMGFAPFDQLNNNIGIAIQQYFDLFGGVLWGKPISPNIFAYALGFAVAIFTIGSIVFVVKQLLNQKTVPSNKNKQDEVVAYRQLLVSAIGAMSIITTLVIYTLSINANLGNIRYITIIPFFALILIVYTFSHLRSGRVLSYIACAVLVLGMVVSYKSIADTATTRLVYSNHSSRVLDAIAQTLKNENVKVLVSGDTIGAPVRFRLNGNLQYTPIYRCFDQFGWNTRLSWYQPLPGSTRTALVIDKQGLDLDYWHGCDYQQIEAFYGTPVKKMQVEGLPWLTDPVYIWIYDHDIRGAIQPFGTHQK